MGDNAHAVRYRSETVPVWTGWIAYRALVPREKLQEINPDHPALTTQLMVSDRALYMFIKLMYCLVFREEQGLVDL